MLSENSGARGRSRTADTAIFSRMLYQLSYPGMPGERRGARLLVGRIGAVHPRMRMGIHALAGNAIALAQPLQQVAVPGGAGAPGGFCGFRGRAAPGGGVALGPNSPSRRLNRRRT